MSPLDACSPIANGLERAKKDAFRDSFKGFKPPSFATLAQERQHRKERLAAGFRIFAEFGFSEGVAGHITARDPELIDHFWVNPLGVHFSRIKVSDLLLVNAKGETVIGDRPTDIEAATAAGLPGFLFAGGDLDAFIVDVMTQTKAR